MNAKLFRFCARVNSIYDNMDMLESQRAANQALGRTTLASRMHFCPAFVSLG